MSNFSKDLKKMCLKTGEELRAASEKRSKRYGIDFGESYEKEFVALLFHNFLSNSLLEKYTIENLGLDWWWDKTRNGKKKVDHPDLTYWSQKDEFEVVEVKAIYNFGKIVKLYAGDTKRINADYEKLYDMKKTQEIGTKHLVVVFLGNEKHDFRDIERRVNDSLKSHHNSIEVIVC